MTPRHPRSCLKLGGSLITDKNRPEIALDDAARPRPATRLRVRSLTARVDRLVVVHGRRELVTTTPASRRSTTGDCRRRRSDGHPQRDDGAEPRRPQPAPRAGRARGAGSPTVAFGSPRRPRRRPRPAALLDGDAAARVVPVLHGDGVATAGAGVTVVSGDELVVELAVGLGARRVGVCSTVPGVLDSDGEVIPSIDSFRRSPTRSARATRPMSQAEWPRKRNHWRLTRRRTCSAPRDWSRSRGRGCRNADRLTGEAGGSGSFEARTEPLFDPRPSPPDMNEADVRERSWTCGTPTSATTSSRSGW